MNDRKITLMEQTANIFLPFYFWLRLYSAVKRDANRQLPYFSAIHISAMSEIP